MLEEIAQGVVEGLGYGVAAISRLEGDILVVTAVGGPEELREQLVGRRTPARLILEEFRMADHWGILRFLPHERLPSETAESLWVPDLEISDDPEAWHPLDALYAPLYSSNGELLGNMAVDLPPGNKIPDQQGASCSRCSWCRPGSRSSTPSGASSSAARCGSARRSRAGVRRPPRPRQPGCATPRHALSEALPTPRRSRCAASPTPSTTRWSTPPAGPSRPGPGR